MSPDVRQIRGNLASYVPSVDHLVLELVALSAMEAANAGRPVTVRVGLTGPLSGEVADTGRGMRLSPDPGESMGHAHKALTQFFPVATPDASLMSLLGTEVWGERGSLGPVVVNAACEAFTFESSRDGETWAQSYRRGVALGPPERTGTTDQTGTRIAFRIDDELFPGHALDSDTIAGWVERLGMAAALDVQMA